VSDVDRSLSLTYLFSHGLLASSFSRKTDNKPNKRRTQVATLRRLIAES